jgi:hypothetical protein
MNSRTAAISACAALLVLVSLMPLASPLTAQRPEPEVYGVFDGDTMYTVLPAGAIPAIMAPEFVTGAEADSQMSPEEPVMGIFLGGEARAYSLWHLDAHEIVNDEVAGIPISGTW